MFLNTIEKSSVKNCLLACKNKKMVLAATLSLCIMLPSAVMADSTPAQTIKGEKRTDISSAYSWSKETSAGGEHVYNIPTYNAKSQKMTDHYYQLNTNTNLSRERYTWKSTNNDDGTDIIGHYIRIKQESDTGNVIGSGVYYNPTGANNNLKSVIGDFIENSCEVTGTDNTHFTHGAGLDNHGIITNVIGDFIGNTMYTPQYNGEIGIDGAGLRNGKTIRTIKGNFIGNTADAGGTLEAFGGGIANHKSDNDSTTTNVTIDEINGHFISNVAKSGGGAIYNNNATITTVKGDFINNQTSNGHGGGIYNTNGAAIGSVNGSFYGNSASKNGGAIYNTDTSTMNVKGDFALNNAGTNGGAIYNTSSTDGQVNLTVDGSFIKNTAQEKGGAIYSTGDINLVADGHKNIIKGNTAGGKNEAIYMEGTPAGTNAANIPKLTIKTDNNGEWIIYDEINGTQGLYNVDMTGGGTVSLFNNINDGNVVLDSTRLNTVNNKVHTYNVNEFTVKGNSSMAVDVDLKRLAMDRIATVDGSNNLDNTGILNVNKMNILNDTKRNKASILFAEEELAPQVRNHGKGAGSSHKVTTPVRMYDIQYNIHPDDKQGYFEFTSDWNPAILAAPVVLQAGAQSAMNTTLQYAFNHLDTYTKIPRFDRLAMFNENKYAFASTDYNENSALRLYNLKENRTSNQGVWLRPYAAFESIPLKNGPKVDSLTYGTFLGFDTDFHEHRRGWHSVWSVYGGYNGGQLDFKNVSANLNGGVLGITDTFYKGNFWTALTATAGALNGDISTSYGHEDATTIYGGIASKTGYNWEFKDGKYILQPIFIASYSISSMLDYTNAAGVRIDADPMHTIQLYPSIRFITNLKNGWQPYARVGMVWNLLNETDIDAGNYHLPEMHMKPYVEYGLGIQKLYKHRFTGFGHAMVRNGGRNGIAVTLGFRYALGRDGSETSQK